MIISIRNEISKSFFFITIKPPSHKKLASTQQLSFPVKSILLNVLKNKRTAIYLLKIFYGKICYISVRILLKNCSLL